MENNFNRAQFVRDLADVINKHGRDGDANTLDFVLAEFLASSLENYISSTKKNKALLTSTS